MLSTPLLSSPEPTCYFRTSFLLLLVSVCLGAQRAGNSSLVSGTVRDPSGAGVAGATVKLTQESGKIERTVQTDATGAFRFEGVAEGQRFLAANQLGISHGRRTSS